MNTEMPDDDRDRCDELANLGLSPIITNVSSDTIGKPIRETVIGKDDVLNVKIALGQANTVEEFLQSI
jgi:hypothetical protein